MIDTLAGIRVVEQGTFITGPCAGMMLVDLGADVIKIESPEGDPYRSYQSGLYSPHFQAYNRNKRSLALDLKNAQDHALFERLVREADVFIQNFRPGTAERLGVGVKRLHEIKGLYAAYGILGALVERGRTNRGRLVEVSMLEAMAHFAVEPFAAYFALGETPTSADRPRLAQAYILHTADQRLI